MTSGWRGLYMPAVEYALYGQSDNARKCPVCSTVFAPKRKDNVYCSHGCKNVKNQRSHVERKKLL